MEIANCVALVTEANGGLGRYYVEALRSLGAAKIYAGARNPEKLTDLVAIDSDRIVPVALEITDAESVKRAASLCQDVTLLIDNAGVGFNQGLIAAGDLFSARQEIEVYYFGTLMMCRAFASVLRQNQGGRSSMLSKML